MLQSTKRGVLRDASSRAVVPTRVLGVCRPRQIRTHAKLPKWDECYRYLVDEKQLPVLEPEVAKNLVASGAYALVDVRPPGPFADSHPAGAINVPLYQPLDWAKPDAAKVLKFIAYSFNGVQAVEPNPNFAEQLKAATAGGTKGIITVCEAGGTLKPSTNFPLGKPSRSLQAAYLALAEEISNKVAHLDRGVYGWFQADLPFEGTKEYKPDVGRTPMAAKEPTLLTGYTMRQEDKK